MPNDTTPKTKTESSQVISFRLDLAGQERLNKRAKKAGLSATNFARAAALSSQVRVVQTQKADPELMLELSRIGNNLNQIALRMNATGKSPRQMSPLLLSLSRLHAILDKAIPEELTPS